MDIIKFNNPTSKTKMEQGDIVNGIKTKMWVERYREAGEFKFVGNISSGIREKLPIGTFVSHTDSFELMLVENHEINDDKGKETEVVITGRGYETYLENRIVGSNQTFPFVSETLDYQLGTEYSWTQAVIMIQTHTIATYLNDDDNAIPYLQVLAETITGTYEQVPRLVKRGSLYSRLMELLSIDNLGIKVIRPGIWSPLGATSEDTAFLIHKGVDRSATVVVSYDTGEIESADYLWSNKRLKNAAVVSGRWVEVFVTTSGTGFDRRVMYLEASDVDNSFSVPPTGDDLTVTIAVLQQIGLDALKAQNDVILTKAEVSKESLKAVYRKDFAVGDVITVNGDYNETSKMRISEYVEIEDETGQTGYPTLSIDP